MNTPGMANYSKATVGLRQPVQIRDQQFRLIYVYPILFADVLNQMEFKNGLRAFLSISFLREIFVSNSLNIIQMASQIPPSNQQQSNVAQMIGNAVLTSRGTMGDLSTGNMPNYNDNSSSYQLQQRVETKTNQIMKYLLTDARTKKLHPQIEIVTLNNLIDVPVIVGTKDCTIPTYPLIYVLLIAIATKTPLDKYSNIEKIVRVLKKTREKDWITLLTSFTNTENGAKGLVKWANNNPGFRNRSQLGRFSSWFVKKFMSKKEEPIEERDLAPEKEYDKKEETDLFNMLKLIKNSLDDLSLFFRFVLDPNLLKQQIGLDISNNSMETTVMKLSSNQYQIFTNMHDQFMQLMAVPGSVFLSSVFNTLYPVNTTAGGAVGPGQQGPPTQEITTAYRLNFLELKEKHIDSKLNQKIQTLIFDTFVTEIKNSLSQYSPDEANEKIQLLKKMCVSLSSIDRELQGDIRVFFGDGGGGSSTVDTVNFDMNTLDQFTSSIHKFASQCLSQTKRLENVFSQIVKNGKTILKIARTTIYSSIEEFMRDIYSNNSGGNNYTSAMTYNLGIDSNEVRRTYIPQMTDTLFVIFNFFFLYRLQSALCEYIQVLDVEIDAKVNDVIDFPNYTMVITTDVLKAVYTAYMASDLKRLLSKDQMYQVGKISQNNIKGMIKVLSNKLKIPSVIVYDENRKEYYYKFMFMSSAEKISGTALDSFVKTNSLNKKY